MKGWCLWAIEVSGDAPNLWILTKERDSTLASRKAATFMRRRAAYRNSEVKAITYRGTIDS
jgi:hypothetical protein